MSYAIFEIHTYTKKTFIVYLEFKFNQTSYILSGNPAHTKYLKVKELLETNSFFFKLIYLFLAALNLRCCMRAFSSWRRAVATLRCGARASHCGGFSCCGARALGARASVVVARGLRDRKSVV